jgi:hypothetical protein
MKTIDFSEILFSLDLMALIRIDKNNFSMVTRIPEWLDVDKSLDLCKFDPSVLFPYLEVFLPEAESFWKTNNNSGKKLISDIWSETDKEGVEKHFEAIAIFAKDEKVLIIKLLGKSYEEKLKILQKAREKLLEFEKLSISDKNIRELYDEMLENLRFRS